jgi:hypothetical protein
MSGTHSVNEVQKNYYSEIDKVNVRRKIVLLGSRPPRLIVTSE